MMKKLEKYKGKRRGAYDEYGDRNPGKFETVFEYQTPTTVKDEERGGEHGCANYTENAACCTAASQWMEGCRQNYEGVLGGSGSGLGLNIAPPNQHINQGVSLDMKLDGDSGDQHSGDQLPEME